jgi:hypothetical protein
LFSSAGLLFSFASPSIVPFAFACLSLSLPPAMNFNNFALNEAQKWRLGSKTKAKRWSKNTLNYYFHPNVRKEIGNRREFISDGASSSRKKVLEVSHCLRANFHNRLANLSAPT